MAEELKEVETLIPTLSQFKLQALGNIRIRGWLKEQQTCVLLKVQLSNIYLLLIMCKLLTMVNAKF